MLKRLVIVFLLSQAAGCGKPIPPRISAHPVSGKVFFDGKPATRAEVSLRAITPFTEPSGKPILPYGKVAEDGSFQIGTYESSDGAPVGEYTVTIVWPKVTIEGGEESIGPDQLQGRYNDPQRPIAKVVVKEGNNEIPPIQLKR